MKPSNFSFLLLVLFSFAAPTPVMAESDYEKVERESKEEENRWRQRHQELKDQVAEAQSRYDEAQQVYQVMKNKNHPKGDKRTEIVKERDDALEALEAVQLELDNLPAEAKRAGALPGWLR